MRHRALEILTNLSRADLPEITDIAVWGTPKCLATRAISSAFALPSTGGERSRAVHRPVSSRSSELTGERGFARTVMTTESWSERDAAGRDGTSRYASSGTPVAARRARYSG
jgi:hypothetical protein